MRRLIIQGPLPDSLIDQTIYAPAAQYVLIGNKRHTLDKKEVVPLKLSVCAEVAKYRAKADSPAEVMDQCKLFASHAYGL